MLKPKFVTAMIVTFLSNFAHSQEPICAPAPPELITRVERIAALHQFDIRHLEVQVCNGDGQWWAGRHRCDHTGNTPIGGGLDINSNHLSSSYLKYYIVHELAHHSMCMSGNFNAQHGPLYLSHLLVSYRDTGLDFWQAVGSNTINQRDLVVAAEKVGVAPPNR